MAIDNYRTHTSVKLTTATHLPLYFVSPRRSRRSAWIPARCLALLQAMCSDNLHSRSHETRHTFRECPFHKKYQIYTLDWKHDETMCGSRSPQHNKRPHSSSWSPLFWERFDQNDGEFREQSCEAVRFLCSSYRQNLFLGSYSSTLLIIENFRRPAWPGMFTCNSDIGIELSYNDRW